MLTKLAFMLTNLDVNPETNDLELDTRLLLRIIIRTVNEVPEDEELDLALRTWYPMEKNEISSKIPAKEVIHIHMKTFDIEFFRTKPTHKS